MVNIIKQISKYNHSSGNNIQYIVIHSTGNTNDTAKNNADYFGRADRQASAHYFVDNNSIYQVVEENQASWHCGDGHNKYGIGNHNSIAIEMCGTADGNISDSTVNNTIELVRNLQSKYGINNNRVVRHYDASRKICPEPFSHDNWARWQDFKNRLSGNSSIQINTNSNEDYSYKGKYGLITGNDVRLREGANTSSNILGYANKGDKFKIGYKLGNWYSVYWGEHGAFISASYLSITTNNSSNGSNDWIRRLQAECNNQGFSNQKVDGYPGKNTLDGCPMLKRGASGNITRILQERLNTLGYGTNGIDGIFGWGTFNAVSSFQGDNELRTDGVVGRNTWKVLLGL